jgi:hypothetical protein
VATTHQAWPSWRRPPYRLDIARPGGTDAQTRCACSETRRDTLYGDAVDVVGADVVASAVDVGDVVVAWAVVVCGGLPGVVAGLVGVVAVDSDAVGADAVVADAVVVPAPGGSVAATSVSVRPLTGWPLLGVVVAASVGVDVVVAGVDGTVAPASPAGRPPPPAGAGASVVAAVWLWPPGRMMANQMPAIKRPATRTNHCSARFSFVVRPSSAFLLDHAARAGVANRDRVTLTVFSHGPRPA